MMKVKLKKIKINNFKGIASFEMDFDPAYNNICGANGSGKTTIEDAFRWCLFGTNSKDEAIFEIKTIDHETGKPIPRRNVDVVVTLDIDGIVYEINRKLIEKYKDNKLQGNTTELTIDGLPYLVSDFNSKMKELIPQSLFKTCATPTYFTTLSWQEQMVILRKFSPEEPIFDKSINHELSTYLTKHKCDFEALHKLFNKKLRELKDDAEKIPIQIAEASRTVLTTDQEKELNSKMKSIKKRIAELSPRHKTALEQDNYKPISEVIGRVTKLQRDLGNAKIELENVNNVNRSDYNHKYNNLVEAEKEIIREIDAVKKEVNDIESKIASYTLQIQEVELLMEEKQKEELVIDKELYLCPTCKKPLDTHVFDEKKQTIFGAWNTNKSKELSVLSGKLNQLSQNNIDLNKRANYLTGPIGDKLVSDKIAIREQLEKHIKNIPIEMTTTNKIDELTKELEVANAEYVKINAVSNKETNHEAVAKELDELNLQLPDIHAALMGSSIAKKRRAELEITERDIADERNAEEKNLSDLKNFEKMYKTKILSDINSKFKIVQWRLFYETLDGTEKPTCVPMVDNVPYSTLNTAMQINAGLDIVNTFSEYNNFYAPIFIDNRERVTNIIASQSQLINLTVSPLHEKLTNQII